MANKNFKSAVNKTQPTNVKVPKSKGSRIWDELHKWRNYKQTKRRDTQKYKLDKLDKRNQLSQQQIEESGKTSRTVARWSNLSSTVAPYLGQRGYAAIESAQQNINGGLTETGDKRDEDKKDEEGGDITFPGAR